MVKLRVERERVPELVETDRAPVQREERLPGLAEGLDRIERLRAPYEMRPAPVALTDNVRKTLATVHLSEGVAQRFRQREHWATEPAPGKALPFERAIVVSDLHLGAGRSDETGHYSATEDFTETEERQFISMMEREWRRAGPNPPVESITHGTTHRLRLVFNGDVIDFLRMDTERPGLPYPDGRDAKGSIRYTPANVIVQLQTIRRGHPEFFRAIAKTLLLGHPVDMLPGNHDRPLYHPAVWRAFEDLLRQDMADLQALPGAAEEAIGLLTRKPFATYGNAWVDHGDHADTFNRLRRPYKEVLEPVGMHEEMEMSLGDMGVRGGFNKLQPLDPTLAGIIDKWTMKKRLLRHPILSLHMAGAFLHGVLTQSANVSLEADRAQRMKDIETMVARDPRIVERMNALRPEAERLTEKQVVEGLQAIEADSATPLFSNFSKSQGFFKRMFSILRLIKRSTPTVNLERGITAQKHFGVSQMVEGHTHVAADDTMLVAGEKTLHRINTHTWMNIEGPWGRTQLTWGNNSRGVGVIEHGVDAAGTRWSKMELQRAAGDHGELHSGAIYDPPDHRASKDAARALAIHADAVDELPIPLIHRKPR